MHEMGIALQIIDIATASIPTDMASGKIERVNLQVGKLTAVVPSSLRFCFEIAAKETPLAGAELVIEELPVVAQCQQCDHKWTIEEAAFTCPECQGGELSLLSGRELDIKSIEVADEKDQRDDPQQ